MGTPALNDPDPSSDKQVDEPDLARRAASGDRRAFAALYDRHVDAVYRYAYFRLRVNAEAEDVTSEVFHRALVAMPRFEPRRPFLAFLYTIARNVITDRMRRERPQASFEDALAHPSDAPGPEELASAGDEVRRRRSRSSRRSSRKSSCCAISRAAPRRRRPLSSGSPRARSAAYRCAHSPRCATLSETSRHEHSERARASRVR